MGNSYVNSATRAPRDVVIDALRAADARAFVAPAIDGVTVFAEAETDAQDTAAIEALGTRLSAVLPAPVWTVLNHDDDVLAYWLFDAGKVVDRYDSWPDYFDGDDADPMPEGGDAARLAAAFRKEAADDLAALLRAGGADDVFAIALHGRLCACLGVPIDAAGFGYGYAEEGDVPDDTWLDEGTRL